MDEAVHARDSTVGRADTGLTAVIVASLLSRLAFNAAGRGRR
jgi:hypothetical protein